jgi:hypothetical protein
MHGELGTVCYSWICVSGFGDNIRVVDWALRRCDGDEKAAVKSPIGYVPAPSALNTDGIKDQVDLEALFSTPKEVSHTIFLIFLSLHFKVILANVFCRTPQECASRI